jgi:hypothetical protein
LPKEFLVNAKNGYTILAEKTALHSRYDPESEAEKFIDTLYLAPYKIFILLEPGLNYLSSVLIKKYPFSKIISLHCSSFFNKENLLLKKISIEFSKKNNFTWNPSSDETLEDFLEKALAGADAADIKLIEWKPSINIYGKSCFDLTSRTVECIRCINAGRKTVSIFGKRWLKNALHNLEFLQNTITAAPGSKQIIVCAAGPGLEDSIDKIKELKKREYPPLIISVSSAGTALINKGIIPDIIITSDGGSWARFHLTECFRQYIKLINKKPVIVSSLTAMLPSQIKNDPVMIIRDGSLWQDLLLQTAGIFSPAFPQRGTVSISALDLAFYLSKGNIYASGFDFAHRDLLTHARPYAFEKILEQQQCRKNPVYSQLFKREEMIRNSGSHNIYESWFTNHLCLFPDRLFFLGKSKFGIPHGDPFQDIKNKNINYLINNKKAVNKEYLIEILINALENPQTKNQIGKELGELLLPEISDNDKNLNTKIIKNLRELACG